MCNHFLVCIQEGWSINWIFLHKLVNRLHTVKQDIVEGYTSMFYAVFVAPPVITHVGI